MRLVSLSRHNRAVYGLLDGKSLRVASGESLRRWPDMQSVLTDQATQKVQWEDSGELDLESDVLLPTISSPGKLLCVGMNYQAHIREMGREPPDHPTIFVRHADTVVGHNDSLRRPRNSTHYDFEGELAFVIGKRARHVSRQNALEHVAGYTIFMDGSVRDFQRHTSQFTMGKNFPASGAMGPVLVTTDEISNPAQLELETRVNGERMQSGEIGDLCFDVPAIIEYLSSACVLNPGDVIATGTPSGVGAARTPPRWLAPGDRVEVSVSGIGTLVNVVADEAIAQSDEP